MLDVESPVNSKPAGPEMKRTPAAGASKSTRSFNCVPFKSVSGLRVEGF